MVCPNPAASSSESVPQRSKEPTQDLASAVGTRSDSTMGERCCLAKHEAGQFERRLSRRAPAGERQCDAVAAVVRGYTALVCADGLGEVIPEQLAVTVQGIALGLGLIRESGRSGRRPGSWR